MALALILLVAASTIVFALQAEATAGVFEAHAALARACSRWAARGGVHYTMEFMGTRHPGEPAKILEQNPPPAFYTASRTERFGWIVAGPGPLQDESRRIGVRSEQGRIPLTNMTTGAMQLLFSDPTVREAISARLASALPPAVAGPGPASPAPARPRAKVFTHPFELLAVPGVEPDLLFGQDLNDNGLLDPHERARRGGCPRAVTQELGLEADRGVLETLTTFTDGKFDPFGSLRSIREIYLADWPGAASTLEQFPRDRPLEEVMPRSRPWARFVASHLARRATFFRIPVTGLFETRPLARIVCVVEYVTEPLGRDGWFRIVNWQQDG